ncbi:MAG: substrate-binding domain-containing protein [Trueperaceae bacterium]|nr:substrate-binding domain-containing protein [Trueperaceae bacterium]
MKRFLTTLAALTLTAAFGLGLAQDVRIAMIPKLVGIDYFAATEQGATQAANELDNVELIHRGPTTASVNDQIQLIENFITAGVDVIAVSANDPQAIAPALERAMDEGIHVVTFDADANARDLFVNQATFEGIGVTMIEEMVAQIGEDGRAAVVTSSLTAPNQNAWLDAMEAHIEENYPDFEIVDVRPAEEDQQRAFTVTQDLMQVYPDLEGVFGLSSVAFPGAAEAVQQADRAGEVAVVGLSTPRQMKPFMDAGVIESVILWNPIDLGYLAVYAGEALATDGLAPGNEFDGGDLGTFTVQEDDIGMWVLLGDPFVFRPDNIDDFDF